MGEICILSGGEFLGIKFQECIDAPPKEERKEDAGWFKKAAAKLEQIVESKKDKSSSHTDYFPRGGGCFTGDAQLLKKGGSTITFDEIAKLSNLGAELPEIASWNEESAQIVYQKPSAIIDHGVLNSSLVYIAAQSENDLTIPLKVTDNHRLLVERDGIKEWVQAGKLKEGDSLVGLSGNYSFDETATIAVEGGFGLFNLSFMTESGNPIPTYLVSSDGITWFVAHNLKY